MQQEGAVDDPDNPVVELDLKLVAVKRFGCSHSEHRVDVRLQRFLDGHGGLIPEAYLNRPNPADIGWLHRLPARDIPRDVLEEALVHAAQNERPEAVAWLLEHGPDPNAGPYQGCGALHLAAAFGAINCVRLLVAAGADVDRRNDFNGDPGVTGVRDYLRGLGSRPAVGPREGRALRIDRLTHYKLRARGGPRRHQRARSLERRSPGPIGREAARR